MEARELEAVGIIARGIAHDFDELMTAVLGNISVAKKNVASDSKVHHLLTNAEEVSLRSRDLTQQLIAFSKRGTPVRKPIIIGEILKNVTLAALGGESIAHNFSIPENLRSVAADEDQISQVIRNIVLNAKEAMAGIGQLTVSAADITVRDRDNLPVAPGDYVRLSTKDSAAEIPIENSIRIFAPNLNVIDTGAQKQTGLGLAIAYSIVSNHDGAITVESEVGKGTTFHVYLPAAK